MKGITNGGKKGYTELTPTFTNMSAIGTNQQAMLIMNSTPMVDSTEKISGIIYFVGPMIYGGYDNPIWGAIHLDSHGIYGSPYVARTKSSGFEIVFASGSSRVTKNITSANLRASARLYVADLPGGGAVELLTCTVSMMEAVA